MNPITDEMKKGTIGEVLVFLKLLMHDVQGNFVFKDTGNDMLAVKGRVIKAVQVKTDGGWSKLNREERMYDIAALVKLKYESDKISLDKSEIYLLSKAEADENIQNIRSGTLSEDLKERFKLSPERIEGLFT